MFKSLTLFDIDQKTFKDSSVCGLDLKINNDFISLFYEFRIWKISSFDAL